MERKKDLYIAMYDATFHFVATASIGNYIKNHGFEEFVFEEGQYPKVLDKDTRGIVFNTDKFNYYTVVPFDVSNKTMIHESIHLWARLCRDRGIRADFNNDETLTYPIAWIADSLIKFLNE